MLLGRVLRLLSTVVFIMELLQQALIQPLLKKPNLDPLELKNY